MRKPLIRCTTCYIGVVFRCERCSQQLLAGLGKRRWIVRTRHSNGYDDFPGGYSGSLSEFLITVYHENRGWGEVKQREMAMVVERRQVEKASRRDVVM